jgi:nitroreductase
MQLDSAIKNRRSIRRYKRKKPDWREILEAIEFARYAPMAGNCFTPRFILVKDEKLIDKLAKASQQPFCSSAHYIVVVCSDKKLTTNAYSERGEKYIKQQAGASIQNFLLKLHELGLATCWTGHFVDSQVKEALKIPDFCDVEAMFPIGYPDEKPKDIFKIELDNYLFFDIFDNSKMTPPKIPKV